MTDLQISLMAIGGTIVVGVISYNKWQEYKERKAVDRAFADTPDGFSDSARHKADISAVRTEPKFTSLDSPPDVIDGISENLSRPEQEVAVAMMAQATNASISASDSASDLEFASPLTPASVTKELPVDALVDCVIPLALGSNVWGEKVIGPIQALRHVGNKPVNFVGQREDGSWEAIQHGTQYSALLAGVQLANRGTALNEIEFSELVSRLRQVADEVDAEPDVPNMSSVMQSARALHQFITQYDAQLSVNLQSNGGPWAINTLKAALQRQGFDVRPDGRLIMSDGDSGILFSLSTNTTLAEETTSRLTLLLDVPRVAPDRDGFGAMTACARSLSHRLSGRVVDDTDQPLSDAALAEIGEQVRTFYGHMQAADIPAGSTRALRLFS